MQANNHNKKKNKPNQKYHCKLSNYKAAALHKWNKIKAKKKNPQKLKQKEGNNRDRKPESCYDKKMEQNC